MSNHFGNNIDPVLIQKMVFVYNALNDGWTIKKKADNRFEFIKNFEHETEEIKREINLDDYLRKFLQFNLNINNLTNTKRTSSF